MESKGWVKLDRNLLEHPLWNEKPFSKGQAWIDILLSVHWKNSTDRIGGKKKKSKPGQCWTTLGELSERWGWHKESVRRFLHKLECDGSVSLYVTADATRLTVENWASYQHDVSDDVTGSVSGSVFPTYYIKNKEERSDPLRGDDPDDQGMTEEEWNEFIRVQAGRP